MKQNLNKGPEAAYFSQSRREMLDYVPRQVKRVLEVGCGSGEFGLELKRALPHVEIHGIERDAAAARAADKHFDKVWAGAVSAVLPDLKTTQYDLIVFNDILEHLSDPWECLGAARRLVGPGGQILASIPNMRFWPVLSDLVFQADWRYRDAGVMDRTHLRFFTRKSIERLFRDCDYEVIKIAGINETSRKSVRWRLINAVSVGRFSDCVFPQFAVIATPREVSATKPAEHGR